ncbi:NAD(P)-dependent oxidoreductase [Polynucleobacter sp. AP-Ainpum-60-G11]|uniref:NAD-dependent epimerase/dehydratase family protein n=1 Tax=Polynucleobacter sp. AP-Ainpum-60-G11 TaxID=2576926 RepID=UPI001BFEDD8B|nr:NAD(P)-dependent oxidoreductase [Polynucleobacter sp. AP-Ainpum-60-G11]QWE27012.1 NAD(P)-dependent oxidoreductase [Polynucleobacter sp. AP-Ainpum-60-G11]
MSKICVIGGSGFLGSHVSDALTNLGHQVTIFDEHYSRWSNKNQKFIQGNLLDRSKLEEAIEGCQYVYNFAAISDLNDAKNKAIETIEVNILGNAYVLELCRKHNISRFVYASTVYVQSREGGFYGCSKRAAEEYIIEYEKCYGLDYTILRYGSLYGPRANKANGLFRIIERALDTGFLQYEGSPESMREFIHVYDAAEASAAALEEKFKNQSVVLTGQEAMKIADLLSMLAEIIGFNQNSIKFINDYQSGHYIRTPYAYLPKIGKKYVPPMHVDLGQGLLELIEYVVNSKDKNK